jgi:hypothetical protein
VRFSIASLLVGIAVLASPPVARAEKSNADIARSAGPHRTQSVLGRTQGLGPAARADVRAGKPFTVAPGVRALPAGKPNLDPALLEQVSKLRVAEPAATRTSERSVAGPSNLERAGIERPVLPSGISTGIGPALRGIESDRGGRPRVAAPPTMLYAPSEADDPAYRAAIATLIGGTVDYFDARIGTPTAAQLAAYDCVHTWADFAYQDRVLFGDRLADYVDGGGRVILGVFCTFTSGNSLGGRIMTAAYCPVTSPAGSNHFSNSAYVGDGVTSLHAGVLAYDGMFRDILVTQGAGIVDGHYADGEIAQAYRPDGRVIYSNGIGAAPLAGTGDWNQIIADAAMGAPIGGSILYTPSDPDDAGYRSAISDFTGGPVNYFNGMAATPSSALLATYDCAYTWANNGYFDRVAMGDQLANFVDAGGKAILGVFCTYTAGNSLGGRIMTPNYSPVTSPTGANHFTIVPYAGDGRTCLHTGVAVYDCQFRDLLVAQGSGRVDGHYADGEIAMAYRPDFRVIYLNGVGAPLFGGGDWPRIVANACMCTPAPHKILYAPSNPDDPPYRAAIAAQSGATVDYFDASLATPSAALLDSYDCVYTWTNVPYDDRVLFGDRLADYVDGGGKVILGGFCTFTIGNSLGGRIMTPGYSPVTSPTGNNHFSLSPYAGDGTTCLHRGVAAYDGIIRDLLVTQGGGLVDGRYADGEIAHAYRPDRRVIYSNGGGAVSLAGTGDWPRLIANACDCEITNGILYASANDSRLYTVNPVTGAGAFIGNLPPGVGMGTTEIEWDPATGRAWLQAFNLNQDQQFSLTNGAGIGAPVANGSMYHGLEFALGRLYGASVPAACAASQLRVLTPTTGVSVGIGATGFGPIVGLAFDEPTSALYGITGGGGGPCPVAGTLLRIDVTSGAAAVIGPTGFFAGSLEFGPDGDLYGGGDINDGGRLYRINRMTGFSALVGSPGFGSMTGLTTAAPTPLAVGGSTGGGLMLAAPAPNPSGSAGVRLSFSLPVAGDAKLELFDTAGRRVWQKALPNLGPGPQNVAWNGRTTSGALAAPGIYNVRLTTPSGVRSVRLIRMQ